MSLYDTPSAEPNIVKHKSNKGGMTTAIICSLSTVFFLFLKFMVLRHIVETPAEAGVATLAALAFQLLGFIFGIVALVKYLRSKYKPVVLLITPSLFILLYYFVVGLIYALNAIS